MSNKLRVLIINYNGEEFLPSCLESLERQTLKDFGITLVDNASEDDSIKQAMKLNPEISVIANNKNLGFAGGVNSGVLKTVEPYFAIITSDCIVSPTWLEALIEEIEKSEKLFAVGSTQLFLTNNNRIKTVGLGYTAGGVAYNLGNRKHLKSITDTKIFAPQIIGSIFNKKIFASLEGLDTNFWKLYEDIDFAWRARKKGLTCVSLTTATFYRMGEKTELNRETRYRLSARNGEWVRHKNMPACSRFITGFARFFAKKHKISRAKKNKCKDFYVKGLQESKNNDIIKKTKIKRAYFNNKKIFFMLLKYSIKYRFSMYKEEM